MSSKLKALELFRISHPIAKHITCILPPANHLSANIYRNGSEIYHLDDHTSKLEGKSEDLQKQ